MWITRAQDQGNTFVVIVQPIIIEQENKLGLNSDWIYHNRISIASTSTSFKPYPVLVSCRLRYWYLAGSMVKMVEVAMVKY